jgi:hypothetical protein
MRLLDPRNIRGIGAAAGAVPQGAAVSRPPVAPGGIERQQAVSAQLHADQGQTVLVYNYRYLPASGVIPVEANVVEWRCPAGHVAEITHIAMYFEDPVIPCCQALGWSLCINNVRMPHIANTTSGALYHAFGDLQNPAPITPLLLNSGDLVSIRIYVPTLWDAQVLVAGALKGKATATREGA